MKSSATFLPLPSHSMYNSILRAPIDTPASPMLPGRLVPLVRPLSNRLHTAVALATRCKRMAQQTNGSTVHEHPHELVEVLTPCEKR